MNYISFDRTKTEIEALKGMPNTVYFTTDTRQIIVNGKIYGITDVTELINDYDIQIKTWCEYTFEQKQYVDLGLPSGILWATCNIGANSPEEYGDYFAWGEVEPKNYYAWSAYKWCKGKYNKQTKYCTKSNFGTYDGKSTLELADDAARANLGGDWRMPTDAEWNELREHCTWKQSTLSGVNGYKVTSKSNGNSIFLPAAGFRYDSLLNNAGSYCYYWSSSLSANYPSEARTMYSSESGVYNSSNSRYYGYTVRPVCKSAPTLDNTKTKEEVVNSIDGVCYFTTDTHEIYINGESYGGTSLEGYATEQWVKDTLAEVELTTSAALNDLNTRLLDTISDETIDALFL